MINYTCLLYTSDAADERSSVDLGGRRIIKKKKKEDLCSRRCINKNTTNVHSIQRRVNILYVSTQYDVQETMERNENKTE